LVIVTRRDYDSHDAAEAGREIFLQHLLSISVLKLEVAAFFLQLA
jgi:hypothetical protein